MEKNQSFFKKFFVVLTVLYLCIGFLPYFDAVDKKTPQLISLNILNLISLFSIIYFRKEANQALNKIFSSLILILFLTFVVWSFFTSLFAFNVIEVIITSFNYFTFFVMFFVFSVFFKSDTELFKRYLPFIISLILIPEIHMVLSEFIERYSSTFSRSTGLRAFTGNINITAFILLFQIPFLILASKKRKILRLLIPFVFFALTILGSRGANLGLLLILFSFILINIFGKSRIISRPYLLQILSSFILVLVINSTIFVTDDELTKGKDNSSLNYIDRTSNLNTSSTQQRLRFYKHALESISKNFFTGIGSGNWKIESIIYEKPNMTGYKVPYHVHNDYLEIFAETGFIGFINYYGILLLVFFSLYKYYKKQKNIHDNEGFVIFLFLSLLCFCIDSFLNFPTERPISQVYYFSLIALILSITKNEINFFTIENLVIKNNKLILLSLIFLILFSTASLYSSKLVYDSYVNQNFLMVANRGKIKNYDVELVKLIDAKYPNITATSVPIESMKANLLINNDQLSDTIVYMLNQGRNANPYLNLEDAAQAVYNIKIQQFDSAYFYAKKAFYGLPNHKYHFEILTDLIEYKKDSVELKNVMGVLRKPIDESFYKKYLSVTTSIKSSFDDVSKLSDSLSSALPENKYFNLYATMFKVGKENLKKAIRSANVAQAHFDNKNYELAYEKFNDASILNPNEPAYYINAANSLIKIGRDSEAKEILMSVNSNLSNEKIGNSYYLLGLIYAGEENYETACDNFKTALKKGFKINQRVIELVCSAQ